MFYIEKNDKPTWLERKINLIRVQENTIILPLYEEKNEYENKKVNQKKGKKEISTSNANKREKQIEKLANRTNKIISKLSNSKKVVLSKEMQKEEKYVNYLNTYGLEIQDGKWLFEILLPDITQYIIEKKNIEKANISILINDLTDIEFENIKILAQKYKSINIVTNHIEKFKRLEKQLQEDEGIIITITNNKKRSLMKSQIILNIDFPTELINKYNIQDEAIIVNVKGKCKINKKRFNGLNINDYEIDFRNDKKNEQALNNKFYLKDIYQSELYRKQNASEIRKKIINDKVIIKKLILSNGEL